MDFDKLLEDCRPFVRKYCRHLFPTDLQAAEDLEQETFLRALRSRDKYNPALPIKNWLSAITKNLWRDKLKFYAQQQGISLDPFNEEVIGSAVQQREGKSALDRIIRREEVEALYKSIQELPERERQVITLHAEGLKNPEIAHTLGITTENVAVTLSHARVKLKRVLEREADL